MIRSTSLLIAAAGFATAFPAFAQQENKPADAPPPPPAAPAAPPAAPPDAPPGPGEPRPPRPPGDYRDGPPGRVDDPGRPDRPPREGGDRRREPGPGPDRDRGRSGPDGPRRENSDRPDRGDRTDRLDRPDRERGAQGDGRERYRAPESAKKPTPYIGVITAPAPPPLVAQLGLTSGFGLLVEEVLPDSPAQAAGIQRYDVLKQLNDQQLVEPNQLSALLRALGKDADASITLIRKAQEQKVSIKVGEKLLPEIPGRDMRPGFPEGFFTFPRREQLEMFRRDRDDAGGGPDGPRMTPERLRGWRDRMRAYEDEMHKFQERMREWQKKPEGEAPKVPQLPPLPSADTSPDPGDPSHPDSRYYGVRPADLLRDLRPGASADLRTEWIDGASHWDANRARMLMRDRDGEVEVSVKDGHRILTVKKPQGEQIFSGPVDTPEQRNAIPQPFRGKLEALEIHQRSADSARDETNRPGIRPPRADREDSVALEANAPRIQ